MVTLLSAHPSACWANRKAQNRYLTNTPNSLPFRLTAGTAERVFENRAVVQRCQFHKRQNAKEHLPENCQADYDRDIRNAYAMTNYADAKAALEKIAQQLEGSIRVQREAWRRVWKKP